MEKSKPCGREDQWEALTIVYLEIMMSWIGVVPVEMEKSLLAYPTDEWGWGEERSQEWRPGVQHPQLAGW